MQVTKTLYTLSNITDHKNSHTWHSLINKERASQFGGNRKYFTYNDFVKHNYKMLIVWRITESNCNFTDCIVLFNVPYKKTLQPVNIFFHYFALGERNECITVRQYRTINWSFIIHAGYLSNQGHPYVQLWMSVLTVYGKKKMGDSVTWEA
jgi:hypothetical protein